MMFVGPLIALLSGRPDRCLLVPRPQTFVVSEWFNKMTIPCSIFFSIQREPLGSSCMRWKKYRTRCCIYHIPRRANLIVLLEFIYKCVKVCFEDVCVDFGLFLSITTRAVIEMTLNRYVARQRNNVTINKILNHVTSLVGGTRSCYEKFEF